MNTINEIKVKVFAQYLGHKIALHQTRFSEEQEFSETIFTLSGVKSDDKVDKFCVLETDLWYDIESYNDGELLDKLILKPLSAITDEDAKQIVKLEYPNSYIKDISVDNDAIKFKMKLSYSYTTKTMSLQSLTLEQGQYLQSKGYDLPHYLLGGKTLHEAGLAIYETEK